MIEIKNLSKSLGDNLVLNNLNLTIKDGEIFGLVGINGTGKSTLLRTICGIYKPNNGTILIDNKEVFENPIIKKEIFFLSDDPYYPLNSTVTSIINFYEAFYHIDKEKLIDIIDKFNLDCTKAINNYSKGMKRQLFIALAIAIKPKYLLLDEAFDGLDPLARLIFKKEILNLIEEKKTTIIISSHSLRELEDICDTYALLDEKTIKNTGNLEDRKEIYHKYQLAFKDDINQDDFKNINILSFNKIGHIVKIVCYGDNEQIQQEIKKLNPLVCDKINIDFEELFIIEVENKRL